MECEQDVSMRCCAPSLFVARTAAVKVALELALDLAWLCRTQESLTVPNCATLSQFVTFGVLFGQCASLAAQLHTGSGMKLGGS